MARRRNQNVNSTISQKYKLTNAYQKKPVMQQILTFVLFTLHLTLHSIFIPEAIILINQSILFILLGVFYLCILLVGIDYFYITCTDPFDRFLLDQNEASKIFKKKKEYIQRLGSNANITQNSFNIKYCMICKKLVGRNSYHCLRCQRCCQGFDHHCKFLNTCIGSKNYVSFFRMLLTSTFYFLLSIGHCIWVFIQASYNQQIQQATINKWVLIGILSFSFLLLILIDILLVFHIYIGCCRKMTTLQYLYRNTPSNKQSQQIQKVQSSDQVVKDDIPVV